MRTNAALGSMCMLFVLLWSSGWVGSKYSLDLMGPFSFLSWRYFLVVIVLLLVVLLLRSWRRLSSGELFSHVSVGALSHVGYLSTSLMAMQMGVSAGMVAFVTALQPMFTATISRPIVGEEVSGRQLMGIALGLLAVAVVIGDKIVLGGSPLAYALLLGSVLSITVATLIDRRLVLKKRAGRLRSTPISFVLLIHCTSAYAIFTLTALFVEGLGVSFQPPVLFSLLYMAVVVSIGSYGLMFLLLRRMSATNVSSLCYLTPPTTMFLAWVLFGEQLNRMDIVGVCMASAAVILMTQSPTARTDWKPNNSADGAVG